MKIAFFTSSDINNVKYLKNLYLSIILLYKNSEFDFHIFTDDYTRSEIEKVMNFDNIIFHDLKYYANLHGLNEQIETKIFSRVPFNTYARLFIPEIVNTDKFKNAYISSIHIDVDGVLLKRIPINYIGTNTNYSFFPSNTEERYERAIKFIWHSTKKFGSEVTEKLTQKFKSGNYFQCGLIIINDVNRFENLTSTSIDFLKQNPGIDDQNLLNHFNYDHIKVIKDPPMNYRPDHSVKVLKDDVVFLHFAGANKPFNTDFDSKNYSHLGDFVWRMDNE